ncbi:Hypothetical predicted protein [Paramuricea clavata]|uniref:Uncharacterized protein n=1 Tax=Paramuricea clavata TaxID=317549 RepID=A0A7D9JIJ0_PARCT|nr:Hypothetical predicted protein [Paramuricea clavata]
MAVNLCTNIGEKLYWGGTLNDLKEFVSNELKLSGGWTSPGGEVKLFISDTANVSLKWHSKTTKSITLFGDSIETKDLCKLLSTMCKETPENLVNDAVKCQGFDDFKQQMLEFTENTNTTMESLRTEVNQLKFKVNPLLTSEKVVDELRNYKLSLMKENSELRDSTATGCRTKSNHHSKTPWRMENNVGPEEQRQSSICYIELAE